jgi:thioredoxin-like negative regulator of GroEL
MKLREVGEKAFVREVIRANRPVLIHFYAAWCKVSLEIGPIVEQLAKDMAGEVRVVRIDSKKSPRLCARLGVHRFPTQMLFVDGLKVDEILGATTARSLQSMVKTAVAARNKLPKAKDANLVVDASFGRHVTQSPVPVMTVFWDKACAASLKLIEHVNEAAALQKGKKIRIVPVEAARVPAMCARLQLTRFPTTLMFKNGEVVDVIGGVMSPANITRVLKAHA